VGTEPSVVNALDGDDRMRDTLRNDEVIIDGLVARRHGRGDNLTAHNLEDIGGAHLLRREVPVPANDPWAAKRAQCRNEHLQQRKVPLRKPFAVMEVDRDDVHATAGDASNPDRANPMGELVRHEALVRVDANRRSDSNADARGSSISSSAPSGVDNRVPPFLTQRTLLSVSRFATKHPQLLRDNNVSGRAVERAAPG
jgi:hypothetical protein